MTDFLGFENADTLAGWLAGMLAAHVTDAGKEAVKEKVGAAAREVMEKLDAAAGGLWTWLKGRFAGDRVGSGQIEKFEQAPEARRADLAAMLKQHLEEDEEFRAEILPRLTELKDLQAQLPKQTNYAPQVVVGNNNRSVQIQGDDNQAQIG